MSSTISTVLMLVLQTMSSQVLATAQVPSAHGPQSSAAGRWSVMFHYVLALPQTLAFCWSAARPPLQLGPEAIPTRSRRPEKGERLTSGQFDWEHEARAGRRAGDLWLLDGAPHGRPGAGTVCRLPGGRGWGGVRRTEGGGEQS